MKKLLFTVLGSAMILTGCAANGPAFALMEHSDPNEAVIYFYRPDMFFGDAAMPTICIDEVKQGVLKHKGYLVCSVQPGRRMIESTTALGMRPLTMYLDAAGGNEYFVRWWFVSNGMSYSYHLGLIPREHALREIQLARKSE